MNKADLIQQIKLKKSCLCIGLDIDISKIPSHIPQTKSGLLDFNKSIIDATHDLCVAYKPNIAFYESLGIMGWEILAETLDYIPDSIFTIADAKRGDIGNTSKQYAKAFFEQMSFDAITVNPYMGIDSVQPFLTFENKWVILLGLTSNIGSQDFQYFTNSEGTKLYEEVIDKSKAWGCDENMMYVVGATHPAELEAIRERCPNHFFLIPGIGAQGGDLDAVMKAGLNKDVGMLINSTRGIIYAGNDERYVEEVRTAAKRLKVEIEQNMNL